MKTLSILPVLPYPPMGGSDLRNLEIIKGLLDYSGQVAVFGLLTPDKDYIRPDLPGLVSWESAFGCKKKEILPEQILAALKNLPSDYCYNKNSIAMLTRRLEEFRPRVAVLSQLAGYPFFNLLKKYDCKVVLDCHNVEGQLSGDIFKTSGRGESVQKLLIQKTRMIEAKLCRDADHIWVCSNKDKEIIQRVYKITKPVYIVPNTIDVAGYNTPRPADKNYNPAEPVLIFPAYFAYAPNKTAVSWILRELYPRIIKEIPGCRLLLPGRDPTTEMLKAAEENKQITVPGGVTDMRPFLAEADVMIVPLLEGSGTRLKVLEAFAVGLPVISTGKGVEGIECLPGRHYLKAETAKEFTEALRQLSQNNELRQELRDRGRKLVEQNYSLESSTACIAASLDAIRQG